MSKMKQCTGCSKEIATDAKECPSCGAKNKKPVYKSVWFLVVAFFIVVIAAVGVSSSYNKKTADNKTEQTTTQSKESAKTEENVSEEYKYALQKAQGYSSMMHMSKEKTYEQLTSEYAENFSKDAAQYAIDNVNADWKQNALKKAESYKKDKAMSSSEIYDKLVSKSGGQFTEEEAQYAIDNLK